MVHVETATIGLSLDCVSSGGFNAGGGHFCNDSLQLEYFIVFDGSVL